MTPLPCRRCLTGCVSTPSCRESAELLREAADAIDMLAAAYAEVYDRLGRRAMSRYRSRTHGHVLGRLPV